MSTIDEFVARELARTGKRHFTIAEVVALTERYIQEKQAAAEPFAGWKDADIDALMFGQPAEQDGQGAAQETPG